MIVLDTIDADLTGVFLFSYPVLYLGHVLFIPYCCFMTDSLFSVADIGTLLGNPIVNRLTALYPPLDSDISAFISCMLPILTIGCMAVYAAQ